ncbi:MAG: SIMPL domain-containing protein [Candidatus Cloacimonadaceae bacterium]
MTYILIILGILILAGAFLWMKSSKQHYAILGIAFILGVLIFSLAFWQSRQGATSLKVVGYASKLFESDLVKWNLTFQKGLGTNELPNGYRNMSRDLEAFKKYLLEQGIKEDEISILPANSYTRHDNYGNMSGYTLNQSVTVLSSDLDKIAELALSPDFFAERGMQMSNSNLEYLYTKLPELKQQLLSEATSDALSRAKEISGAAKTKLGKMQEARAGVFQITEPYSTDVSDYGIYNTSTRKKSISVTLSAVFRLK